MEPNKARCWDDMTQLFLAVTTIGIPAEFPEPADPGAPPLPPVESPLEGPSPASQNSLAGL